MRTPAGKECKHYYEDFHRGRSTQECRFLPAGSGSKAWHPSDCSSCPVPEILRANASEHLQLRGEIKTGFLGFGRHVQVTARCAKHDIIIDEPMVGCPICAQERADELSIFFGGSDS